VAVSGPKKVLIGVVAAPLVVIALLAAAWGIDTALHSDAVVRNVELAGQPVGGMTRAQLRTTVDKVASQLPDTPVTIDTGEFTMSTTAGALGLSVNTDRTVNQVWQVGRSDPLPTRPVRWLSSVFSPRAAPAHVDVDTATLTAALAKLEADRRTAPVEPSMAADQSGAKLVPGKDGRELTTNAVVSALPSTLGDVGKPITIDVKRTVTRPKLSDASVQALVDQANKVTGGTVKLTAGKQTFSVDGKDFRPAFAVAVAGTPEAPQARLTMKPDVVSPVLAKKAPPGSGNPTNVKFDIQNGTPVAVPGQDAQVCCGPDAPDKIVEGLLAGNTEITLPTKTLTAAEGVAWANTLGVKQVIGQFTTNHPAGQPRVQNIHTISDFVRGALIAPGDTFSLNGYVGRRTAEKGYVMAPVIADGQHVMDIGGGVSQFATTLFNAAFFGGLDIPEHQAHSEYISRYPFGREATVAYPSVDIKVHNETPYGVVIWPTYTGTSVTVQLWSTPYATGAQTAQSPTSGCGEITTERTRTFVDGHTDKQKYYASYKC
jgi:vancomycin resistance protein YoaR